MPLPLVPIGIGAATLITTGIGFAQTLKARNRRKIAQAKFDDARQTYQLNYALCERINKERNDKLAELSYARLQAISALGQAAKVIGQIPISKQDSQGNQDTFDVTPDQISDWQNRSETAEQLLQTLSAVGVGAAGVSSAWLAAGLGTASTGVPISGLSGVAIMTSKLAWLGGGALAIGGGGIKIGLLMLGGLPIGPSILTFGMVASLNAKKFEKVKDEARGKFVDAECELTRWREKTEFIILRIDELIGPTKELTSALQNLLAQNPPDVEVLASISGILAQVIDIPIVDEDGNILHEDVLKDAYRTDLLPTRRDDLSQAYRKLGKAIAIKAYAKAISAAEYILRYIKLF